MKRLIDISCETCSHCQYDYWAEPGTYPDCPNCNTPMQRLWTSTASAIGDDIPGGIMIEHGLCHPGGAPKRYDTKSAIYRDAKAKGLHVGAFLHGSPHGRTWF